MRIERSILAVSITIVAAIIVTVSMRREAPDSKITGFGFQGTVGDSSTSVFVHGSKLLSIEDPGEPSNYNLVVYNISNGLSPQEIGRAELDSRNFKQVITATDDLIYIVDDSDFYVFSNPQTGNPARQSKVQIPVFGAIGLVVDGDILTVGDSAEVPENTTTIGHGIKVFDISDPEEPVLLDGEYNSDLTLVDFIVDSDLIYTVGTSNWDDGELKIIDASSPSELKLLAGVILPGEPWGLHLYQDRLFTILRNATPPAVSAVWEMDISDPFEPVRIAERVLSPSGAGFLASGSNPVPTLYPPSFFVNSPFFGAGRDLYIFGHVEITHEAKPVVVSSGQGNSIAHASVVFEYPFDSTLSLDQHPKVLVGTSDDGADFIIDADHMDDYVYLATNAGVRVVH